MLTGYIVYELVFATFIFERTYEESDYFILVSNYCDLLLIYVARCVVIGIKYGFMPAEAWSLFRNCRLSEKMRTLNNLTDLFEVQWDVWKNKIKNTIAS